MRLLYMQLMVSINSSIVGSSLIYEVKIFSQGDAGLDIFYECQELSFKYSFTNIIPEITYIGNAVEDDRSLDIDVFESALDKRTSVAHKIFDIIFPEKERLLIDERISHDGFLNVRLLIDPHIVDIPWELMTDHRGENKLSIISGFSISRFYPLSSNVVGLKKRKKEVNVLFIFSFEEELAILSELNSLTEALSEYSKVGRVTVDSLKSPSNDELMRAIRDGGYSIVHFAGHSKYSDKNGGELIFDREGGTDRYISVDAFGTFLGYQPNLLVVIFNSCVSASGADFSDGFVHKIMSLGVYAVIAMQGKIGNKSAIEFSKVFYECLSEGLNVGKSISEARKSIYLSGALDWYYPVLYSVHDEVSVLDRSLIDDYVFSISGNVRFIDEFDEARPLINSCLVLNDSQDLFVDDKGFFFSELKVPMKKGEWGCFSLKHSEGFLVSPYMGRFYLEADVDYQIDIVSFESDSLPFFDKVDELLKSTSSGDAISGGALSSDVGLLKSKEHFSSEEKAYFLLTSGQYHDAAIMFRKIAINHIDCYFNNQPDVSTVKAIVHLLKASANAFYLSGDLSQSLEIYNDIINNWKEGLDFNGELRIKVSISRIYLGLRIEGKFFDQDIDVFFNDLKELFPNKTHDKLSILFWSGYVVYLSLDEAYFNDGEMIDQSIAISKELLIDADGLCKRFIVESIFSNLVSFCFDKVHFLNSNNKDEYFVASFLGGVIDFLDGVQRRLVFKDMPILLGLSNLYLQYCEFLDGYRSVKLVSKVISLLEPFVQSGESADELLAYKETQLVLVSAYREQAMFYQDDLPYARQLLDKAVVLLDEIIVSNLNDTFLKNEAYLSYAFLLSRYVYFEDEALIGKLGKSNYLLKKVLSNKEGIPNIKVAFGYNLLAYNSMLLCDFDAGCGDYLDAMKYIQESLHVFPSGSAYLDTLANINYRIGNKVEAESGFILALKNAFSRREYFEAFLSYGAFLSDENKLEKLDEVKSEALKKYPNSLQLKDIISKLDC